MWRGTEEGEKKRRRRRRREKDGWRPRAAAARISERRVSRIPLSPPPYPPPVGGYRLTAIRLNLFHHKRLNKEVHSSARAAKPPLVTREIRPTYPYRPLSTTYDHPSGSLPSRLKASTSVIVLLQFVPLFRTIFSRYSHSPLTRQP